MINSNCAYIGFLIEKMVMYLKPSSKLKYNDLPETGQIIRKIHQITTCNSDKKLQKTNADLKISFWKASDT